MWLSDADKALADEDFKRMCMVLNTADYCHTNVTQLEAKIKEKVDPSMVELIDMNKPIEAFLTCGPLVLFEWFLTFLLAP